MNYDGLPACLAVLTSLLPSAVPSSDLPLSPRRLAVSAMSPRRPSPPGRPVLSSLRPVACSPFSPVVVRPTTVCPPGSDRSNEVCSRPDRPRFRSQAVTAVVEALLAVYWTSGSTPYSGRKGNGRWTTGRWNSSCERSRDKETVCGNVT